MNSVVFSYEEFASQIARFSREVPQLLARHSETSELAPQLQQLTTVAKTPFTMAVVGQMRSGKSSLLNALVGADLAVTGVNETTATINWFKWGQGDQCDSFRVTWKDKPAQSFPLSEIHQWVGDSDHARQTAFIEYFSDAPFLETANIVDTPGTRSVLQDHTNTVREFLAFDDEDESTSLGSSADAILYVVMPVARENDASFLKEFESTTRLPDCSPYNSIAVVHKWEMLDSEDPIDVAKDKAEKIRIALDGLVSAAIPASAPLAVATDRFDDGFWRSILELTNNSDEIVVKNLLLMEEDFEGYEIKGSALAHSERAELRRQYPLPWPCLKAIFYLALKEQCSSISALRAITRKASGIDELTHLLQERFFARSKMIKFFSVLSKAWEPCQIALGRLRQFKQSFESLGASAKQNLAALDNAPLDNSEQDQSLTGFITKTGHLIDQQLRLTEEVSSALESHVISLADAFVDMQADIGALETIDKYPTDFEQLPLDLLKSVCGADGPDLQERARALIDNSNPLAATESVIEKVRQANSGAKQRIQGALEHLVMRLEQLADYFEETATAKS